MRIGEIIDPPTARLGNKSPSLYGKCGYPRQGIVDFIRKFYIVGKHLPNVVKALVSKGPTGGSTTKQNKGCPINSLIDSIVHYCRAAPLPHTTIQFDYLFNNNINFVFETLICQIIVKARKKRAGLSGSTVLKNRLKFQITIFYIHRLENVSYAYIINRIYSMIRRLLLSCNYLYLLLHTCNFL